MLDAQVFKKLMKSTFEFAPLIRADSLGAAKYRNDMFTKPLSNGIRGTAGHSAKHNILSKLILAYYELHDTRGNRKVRS